MTTEELQGENAKLLAENASLRVELANCRRTCEGFAERIDTQASILASRAERFDLPQSTRSVIEEVFTSLRDHLSYVRPNLSLVQCRDKLGAMLAVTNPVAGATRSLAEDEVVIGGEG